MLDKLSFKKVFMNDFKKLLTPDQREWYEERAAILEYDAGLSKYMSEADAERMTKNYFYL